MRGQLNAQQYVVQVVRQILSLDEDYVLARFHRTAVNPMDDLWVTDDGWTTFFALQAVAVLHLGGRQQDQWIFEYIPRGSLVPQRKVVNGKDMYELSSLRSPVGYC